MDGLHHLERVAGASHDFFGESVDVPPGKRLRTGKRKAQLREGLREVRPNLKGRGEEPRAETSEYSKGRRIKAGEKGGLGPEDIVLGGRVIKSVQREEAE
jgi:hypothetical protein